MKQVLRVVFDANVLISAIFWEGITRTLYDLAKTGKISMLSSIPLEQELIRVLNYSKFGLEPAEIVPLINDYKKVCLTIPVKTRISLIKDDLTDNIFLECAVDGKADYIISGDRHLLNLKEYQAIHIVNPRIFLDLLARL